MTDIKSLFVWILGSVMRVIKLMWKLKKTHFFRTFQSLGSWPIGSRVITGFLQSLWSIGSLVFHLFFVSISFAYTSGNLMSREFPRKHKWEKSETYNYIIKHTRDSCECQYLGSLGSTNYWSIFPNK